MRTFNDDDVQLSFNYFDVIKNQRTILYIDIPDNNRIKVTSYEPTLEFNDNFSDLIYTDNISFTNTDSISKLLLLDKFIQGREDLRSSYTNKLRINLTSYSGNLTDGAINSNNTSVSVNLASGYHKTRIVLGDTIEYNRTEQGVNSGVSSSGIHYSYIYPDDMSYFGLSDIKVKFVNNADEYAEDSEGPRLTRVIRPHTWQYTDDSFGENCRLSNFRSEQQLEVPSNDHNGTTVTYFNVDDPGENGPKWYSTGALRVEEILIIQTLATIFIGGAVKILNQKLEVLGITKAIVMKDISGNQSRYNYF